ncbi:MAG: ATP-binding cassette domain-containing protein [Chloroflexi bacterium]|nr:ATP-binding cassette domain-containing protein [Chloroflexota bacterium]
MLQVNRVSKYYGVQRVLDEVSFVINPGDRVGLIGPNGSGKTTLLRIITGLEAPDLGTVSVSPGAKLGYLAQGLEDTSNTTVGEVVASGITGYASVKRHLEALTERLANTSETPLDILASYGDALEQFESLGGYGIDHEITSTLDSLGLRGVGFDVPVRQLSGGQRTRLGLARLLIAQPSILLLDEPTNHLDIAALEWLEEFLDGFHGAVLAVSHDRTFLNNTVSRILALDALTHRIGEYAGDYSDFELSKAAELDRQWAVWNDQQLEIERIQADIERTKAQAQHNEESTNNDHTRRLAKKVAKKAKAREARLRRLMDAKNLVEKPKQGWKMKLDFGEMTRGGQIVVTLEAAGHAYGERILFKDVNLELRHGDRVALVGPNGSGKTTLLRAIVGELELSEGRSRTGSSVRIGYMPQEHETLDSDKTPLSAIQELAPLGETEARNFLHYFLFEGDDVFVPVKQLSFGERARLILAKLVVSGVNCLVLDEPVNHLDIPSRERFEAALDAFPGTVLAAAHDRAFIDRFATALWVVADGTIRLRLPG